MEQGHPNIFPESGILRKSLLSLKRERLPFGETLSTGLTALYKHYLLIFKPRKEEKEEDCIVFDTKNGTTTNVKTGLDICRRVSFSFCYWKDNIYVLFGGVYHKPGLHYSTGTEGRDEDVYFLYVIEKDGQISFEVESCNLKEREWWLQCHSAQVYQDNMYIIGKKSPGTQNPLTVNKFDLNERKWSSCQVTRDVSNTSLKILEFVNFPVTMLFESKIFVFGNYTTEDTGGGLFGNFRNRKPTFSNDMIALDLENMKWENPYDQSFYQEKPVLFDSQVELMNDKIYISVPYSNEFLIYDPIENKFLQSEGFPAEDHWRVKSFKNHSILFKISPQRDEKSDREYLYIQYQNFGQSVEQQNNDPLGATSQQLPHMVFLWKEKPFTDVTFLVQNEEIPAHRVILLKSRYFQNMFNSGMIEAESDQINVPDISPENFKAILEYIYCDKITLTESLAIELIVEADKYFLPDLKTSCENYLSAKLTMTNFVKVMKVAETADSEKLEKKVVNFLTSNIEKVKQEVDIHMIPPELFVKAIMDLKSSKK